MKYTKGNFAVLFIILSLEFFFSKIGPGKFFE